VESHGAGAPVIALRTGGLHRQRSPAWQRRQHDRDCCLASRPARPSSRPCLFFQKEGTALEKRAALTESSRRWAAQFTTERFRDRLRGYLLERY